MNVKLCLILVIVVLGTCDALRAKRRLLTYRKMSKIFVRYNVKTNIVPYTSIFAYAMGFRANWDVQPASILTPKRRYSQVPPQWSYTQYPVYHQRALHDAVKGVFNWHGLNGSACLIRAICEAGVNKHDDVISRAFSILFNEEDLIRCGFAAISRLLLAFENYLDEVIGAEEDFSCPETIDCPVSLLHLVDHAMTSG